MLDGICTPKSPTPELLSHNGPPTTFEAQAVHGALSQVEITIARIEIELKRLLLARFELQRFQNQHKGVVSSLRRLPNEIIEKIIKFCTSGFTNRKVPFVIAHVCRHWRAIAINTAQLWATVRWHHLTVRDTAGGISFLQLMLNRSRNCDLDLQFSFPSQNFNTTALLKAIESQSFRLKKLVDHTNVIITALCCGTSLTRLRILECGGASFSTSSILKIFRHCPALEDVEFFLYETIDNGPVLHLATTMPHLRNLNLNLEADPSDLLNHLTLPNLVAIYFFNYGGSFPLKPFIDLLRRSRASLVDLRLDYFSGTTGQIQEMFDASPDLKTLSVFFDDDPHTYSLLQSLTISPKKRITLPKLESLIVRTDRIAVSYTEALYDMLSSRSAEVPLRKMGLEFVDDEDIHSFSSSPFAKFRENSGLFGYVLDVQGFD